MTKHSIATPPHGASQPGHRSSESAEYLAGAVPGYRPGTTLSMRTEMRRQISRRRTQFALGLMVALPLLLVLAFSVGGSHNHSSSGNDIVGFATSSGANFAAFTIFVSASFLLVVVVALFFGDTVASEASWGSLRYLLAAPVPRSRLLAVKSSVSAVYSAVALTAMTLVSLLIGVLSYGWHPLRIPTGTDPIAPMPAVVRLLAAVGYIGVTLLATAGLAFLLSVLTDAPLGAVGGAVLLTIVSSILEQVTALGNLRALLPTRYASAWLGMFSEPIQTEEMVKGAISALVYATIFFALAWWKFLRKDIVS